MACINPDGTLTPTAQKVLEALKTPTTEAELARKSLLPMFRVRMSLRELGEAGMVSEINGIYQLTEEGAARLET
jgi:hypothetical protein